MNIEGKVLVIGATGTYGGQVLREVLARGGEVRALVRSEAGAASLDPRTEVVLGDLRDPRAVERALQGVSAALYVSPHEPDEEVLAARFFRACEAARVRLVFNGVHIDAPTRIGRSLLRFVHGFALPNYRAKFRIGERARMSSARPIVLVPTNSFQNDLLFMREILAGSFPQPFMRGVNRVDVRDVGVAAARALLDPELSSGAYPVIGPASLTGEECAATWTAALCRQVRLETDPARVNAALSGSLQGKKRDDFIATYAALRRFALPTTAAALESTTQLLGRPPTTYAAYVHETAASILLHAPASVMSLAWSNAPKSAAAGC